MARMSTSLNNSMTCGACQTDLLLGEEFLQCMVETCGKLYHNACNNRALSANERATWVCPECTCTIRKGGRNCEMPVGTPLNVKNIALRKPSSGSSTTQQRQRSSETEVSMSTSATLEIQLLREQITLLTEQLADAVTTIGQYHSALTICTCKVEAISDKLMALEDSINSRGGPLTTAPYVDDLKSSKAPKQRGQTHNRIGKGKQHAAGGIIKPVIPKARPTNEILSAVAAPHEEGPRGIQQSGYRLDSISINDTDDLTSGKWEEPRSKKQRRLTSVRCTAGPNVTTLRAVEDRKHIHLWNMLSGVEEVREYLKNLCPEGTCTVEELKSRGDYKSYKLGVPAACFDRCISADVWPENARVKMWFFPRQRVFS